jgi:glycosyltransferase domain-containing protein
METRGPKADATMRNTRLFEVSQAVPPRLTILLRLKGRPLFTLRFLFHANRARMPFRFLIADGEARPPLSDILENARDYFPNIDITYVRYPDDTSLSRFYTKMHDALCRITTPYAMLADNDDFLAAAGLECAMNFLDAHPDYVCCGTGIAGFSVHAPLRAPLGLLAGPISKVAYRYAPNDLAGDYNSSSAAERVLAGLRNTWSYYAVFRTGDLALIWNEVSELGPASLQLVDRFCAMRAMTLGKARSDPAVIGYWRQYWTSSGSHWEASGNTAPREWVHHLLRNDFNGDFSKIIERISGVAAAIDSGSEPEIQARVREGCAVWLRRVLINCYGGMAGLRDRVRARAPWLVAWLKRRRRRTSVIFERVAARRELRRNGATPEYLARYADELATIEEVLTGQAFRGFLDGCSPALKQLAA